MRARLATILDEACCAATLEAPIPKLKTPRPHLVRSKADTGTGMHTLCIGSLQLACSTSLSLSPQSLCCVPGVWDPKSLGVVTLPCSQRAVHMHRFGNHAPYSLVSV